MIDLDRLESELDLALTERPRVPRPPVAAAPPPSPPAPDPAPAPAVSRCRRPTGTEVPSRLRPSPLLPPAPSTPANVAPSPGVWEDLDIDQHAQAIVDLVGQGRLAEADLHIAAQAELVHDNR